MSEARSENFFSRGLERAENTLLTIAFLVMIIIVFLQILFRYISAVNFPPLEGFLSLVRDGAMFLLPWSEELARYCMLWAVFLGAGVGAKMGVHVGVDAAVRMLPPSLLKWTTVLSGLCSMAFCLSLTVLGYEMVQLMWENGQVSPALEIPMYWAYLSVPVGGFLTAVGFFQAMVGKLREINAGRRAAEVTE